MAIPHPMTQPVVRAESAAPGEQLLQFRRMRAVQAVDAFEGEARRMFQLERQLGEFAVEYDLVVGAAMERLISLEQQLEERGVKVTAELALLRAQGARDAERQEELRVRYRGLAMELHPDRVATVGEAPLQMHELTTAYRRGDLAALLRMEAQLHLARVAGAEYAGGPALDEALRDIARASETYAQGYRELLNSPLNELMLRALAARREGNSLAHSVLRNLTRQIEEKEQMLLALVAASGIGTRDTVAVA